MSVSEIQITIPEGKTDRLDKVLASLIPKELAISRARLQELIQSGQVFQGGAAISNGKAKAVAGEIYEIRLPPAIPSTIEPQDIRLDIVYEDADLLVVNKPAGMVVHPARGARDGTLVNAVLFHAGDQLSGIGGVERPGIVHRIDKDTSGLLVVAKNDFTHEGLSQQFRDHSISREYVAFIWGALDPHNPRILGLDGVKTWKGGLRIDLPIGRHKTDRLRMAIRDDGKHAVTYVQNPEVFGEGLASKIRCRLETGRTHQIRVHLNHIGHPLLGDPVYGRGGRQLPKTAPADLNTAIEALQGQALQAVELGFNHPRTGQYMEFTTGLDASMTLLDQLVS